MKRTVTFFSEKYGVRCKGYLSHQTTSLATIDIDEIEIDNVWIPFLKFTAILTKAFPMNEISMYDVVEISAIETNI